MKIRKLLSENLHTAFISLCLVLLAESGLLRLMGNTSPLAVAVTSLIFTVVTVFLYINRKNSAVFVGTAAVLTMILLILNLVGISIVEYIANTAINFFSGNEINAGETIFITSVMSAILSVVFFPLLKLPYVRYSAALLTLILLFIYVAAGVVPSVVETFASAGIIVTAMAELSLLYLYKKDRKNLVQVLSFLLPLFATFSLIIAVLPSSEQPLSWSFVKKTAVKVSEILTDINYLFNPESTEFNIGLQGYSDDSGNAFGAGLKQRDISQLLLTCSSASPRSSVYLIGNVNDDYSKKGWRKSKYGNFSDSDYYLDYCETVCAFEREGITRDDFARVTAKTGLIIRYDNINTQTMFYPLKTFELYNREEYDASSPSVIFEERKGADTSYSVNYLEINYRSDEFGEIVSSTFDYDTDDISTKHYLDKSIPENIEETLAKRSEYIFETYTKLPGCVTERTYQLADKITADCTNDYDKLCAIEAFLKNYEYTLTPGEVPKGNDPVDYFLFESQKGYCTYFASSMAVLARCEGIPTRYVQGFSVNCSNLQSFLNLSVPGSTAHAWVEAYIEGVGWIPFEPTASFSNGRYDFREKASVKVEYKNNNAFENDRNTEALTETLSDFKPEKDNHSSTYIIVISFSVLGILLVIILYIAVKSMKFLSTYKKSSDTEKFMYCFRMSYYLFARKKLVPKNGETAACFASRVSLRMRFVDVSFEEITDVFDRIRYGNGEASCEEREVIEKYVRSIYQEIKEINGQFFALTAFLRYCFQQ